MKFLPFEDFYIITALKPSEVQNVLEAQVEPLSGINLKNWASLPAGYYFKGYVSIGSFKLTRVISYRNSFLPQIDGSTEPLLNGSRVHVKMRMHIAVMIFMGIWLSGAAFGGLAICYQKISEGRFGIVDCAAFAMFLFGYALATGGFKYESSNAKTKLLELLDGEIE